MSKNGELNPFLEKFFYIEGLYSNNLRIALSGVETNHPDKSNNLFKQLKKSDNLKKDLKTLYGKSDNKTIDILMSSDSLNDLIPYL